MGAAQEDRNRRLLRARDAIDRRSTEDLDVDALAAIALMGRSHFIREFARTFGETPHRYLQRRRIERAMTLLRTTDTPVTDVCMAVGFSSLGTFSRTFSEVVGVSPSVFRAGSDPATAFVPTAFRMRWTRPAGERGGATDAAPVSQDPVP
ncbi:helix-turn-helix transcriptional regulator [Phycicoccus flavus]|uniref:helix-turn-helix transcriptional regulator n=1 Tax=Phycicoccus flavus TaxID=2502783 RepID=UPI000FEC0A60|nr:helix-turn-helix transcriptional regulator [Phycicoccus flavus]NHA68347.1 helix-turn-helix transcriptional regulator [Phycicoccus flavus]